jgi:putative acetyltransferase
MISIRKVNARAPDVRRLIKALDDYQSQLYPAASCYQDAVEELDKSNVHFIGAYEGARLLACGAVKVTPGDCGELKRMFVRPEARGRGLGHKLIESLEAFLVKSRVFTIRLETGIHHSAALAFYEQCGFNKRGPFGAYSADPLSVFMEKHLA